MSRGLTRLRAKILGNIFLAVSVVRVFVIPIHFVNAKYNAFDYTLFVLMITLPLLFRERKL
jgi:hypothetical protein